MNIGLRFVPRLLALTAVTFAAASARAESKITEIAVYPADVKLSTSVDMQRYVVVATRDDGVTLDITSEAQLKVADPNLVEIKDYAIYPKADGTTSIEVTYGEFQVAATVAVEHAAEGEPISWDRHVMPVFLRAGCNTGSCHGAARGKDGFMLSLFGYDPDGDYFRTTRDLGGRRINLALPERSLLVEKSIGSVPHTGGKRFEAGSKYYNTLIQWLEEGATKGIENPATVDRVELFPPRAVLEGADATQQFIVRAHYSDGSSRDVTDLAVFSTNNDNSAPINENGLATAASRGEAFVMARFDTHTVVSQVLVLPQDLQYTAPEITGDYVDQLVGDKLKKLRIFPSEVCSDEEFIRRATIDITGMLPTVEEYEQFLADQAADKRAKLIDRLLERKEFSEIWAMKWSELLMIRSSNQVSYKSMFLYSSWLTDKIANDVPLDVMVRDILSASGGTFSEPQTNYYQIERDTLKTAENVAQVFMGIRTQCAQCHNHPFDRWTMNDYYGFAAFFSQIGRKNAEDYREQIIFNRGGGEVQHPVTKQNAPPTFLGGSVADVAGKDRRAVLADWLTAPDNPYFAKNIANRVWAHFFGIGIVEPIDDVRITNPPSNPELLDALATKLVESNYDFKQLVRDICNSHAYQRSIERNESNAHDELNFAHGNVRRVPAEMLLDCINQVTETKDKFKGLPLGSRAVQIADGSTNDYFLTTFGRSTRETVCACEVKTDPTLSQALHMINGPAAHNKIGQGGVVKRLLDEGQTHEQVINSLYARCLSRAPTPEEQAELLKAVAAAESPQAGLEDVFWALLNSREFMFNH